jgi:hypothetical protein
VRGHLPVNPQREPALEVAFAADKAIADLTHWLDILPEEPCQFMRNSQYVQLLSDQGPFIWDRVPRSERRRLERKFGGGTT